MVTYDIKERLLQFLKQEKISVARLETQCGFSKRYFSNVKYKVPAARIKRISAAHPQLNTDWLLTGSGTMLYPDSTVISRKKENNLNKWYSEILTRLRLILHEENITPESFEELNESIRKGSLQHPTDEEMSNMLNTATLFIRQFPQYSPTWIIYGEGPQSRTESSPTQILSLKAIKEGEKASKEYLASPFESDFLLSIDNESYSRHFKKGDLIGCMPVEIKKRTILSARKHLIILKDGTTFIRNMARATDCIRIYETEEGKETTELYMNPEDIEYAAEIVGCIRHF